MSDRSVPTGPDPGVLQIVGYYTEKGRRGDTDDGKIAERYFNTHPGCEVRSTAIVVSFQHHGERSVDFYVAYCKGVSMEFIRGDSVERLFDVCGVYAIFTPSGTISRTFYCELDEFVEGVYDVPRAHGVCDP